MSLLRWEREQINVGGEKSVIVIDNSTSLLEPSESYISIKPTIGTKIYIINPDIRELRVIEFNSSINSLAARLPFVNASGVITFNNLKAYANATTYIPLAGTFGRAMVQGDVTFSSQFVSPKNIIFSYLYIKGIISDLSPPSTREELALTSHPNIPWFQVLLSPYNLFIAAICIFFIITEATKSEIKLKIDSLSIIFKGETNE
jgi:hypothetical protein